MTSGLQMARMLRVGMNVQTARWLQQMGTNRWRNHLPPVEAVVEGITDQVVGKAVIFEPGLLRRGKLW